MHNSRLPHIALGLSMIASSSCWFKKTPPNFTPPPAQAQPAAPADPPSALPVPPKIEGDTSAVPPAISPTVPNAPEPPKQKPGGRSSRGTPTPPKVTTPPPQTPEQPAPPKLEPLLTADKRREYNHTIDECLDRVKKALVVFATKRLTPEQSDIVTRITTFQRQAEEAREQDLLTAVGLAKRADLFAQDLLGRLQ
jgi:hypothetical protein